MTMTEPVPLRYSAHLAGEPRAEGAARAERPARDVERVPSARFSRDALTQPNSSVAPTSFV